MSLHGFNGDFSYNPKYVPDDEEVKAVAEVVGGASTVKVIVYLQIEDGEKAVLFNAIKGADSERCIMLISENVRYFMKPDEEVTHSKQDFERSFNTWTVGGSQDGPIRRRSNLWQQVYRLSNDKDRANRVIDPEQRMLEIVEETEIENGMVEWEVEYDDTLVNLVADHYDVDEEDVGEQLISDFIVVALYKQTQENV